MAEPPSTKGKAPRVPSVAAAADHPQSTAGPPASLIRWERFLPRRSLRVLLVEHDDSTRHVVGALLRKCNYHVAGVADGMKAWEVMTERKFCFDLVLTEIATPSLSGIGLLTRIVATEECKNIPVIMMSTHDSVNVVLKCMLKGAVDFLVKPVRKNELRNLWQHVWRRHCSSSYANASDNDTASNQISVDAGDQSKTGENNDEPSDFQEQSSGTKPDIDIESAQQQTEPAPDEDWTCTMKGGATLDQHDSDVANLASASKIDYGRESRGYKPVGVAVDVTSPVQEASKAEKSPGNHSNNISPSREENLDVVRYSKGDNDNHKSCCQNNASNGLVQKKVVFVEPISDGQYSYTVLKKDALVQGGLCKTTKSYHIGDTSNAGTSPLWELSLRRPQTNGCVDPELKENHVLKHSKASAFSRYGDKGIQSSWHKSYSSDLFIRTKEVTDKDNSYISSSGINNEKSTPCSPTKSRLPSPRRNGDEATKYPQVSSNNEEKPPRDISADHSSTMGDTALRHTPYGFMPLPIPVGAAPYHNLCGGFGTIMQPVFYPETSLAPLSSAAFGKPVIEIHHYPSSHHTSHLIKHPLSLELPRCEETHKSQHWRQAIDISEPGEQRELSCIPTEQAYQSGSCGHDVRKGSGSNGSGETADGAGATAAALESGNESGVQNCNRRALDYDRSRREAALLKFRMKRKERCFEKKVRYYSRKKLAEQRPRIKGQFVRPKIVDSTASEADN